MNSPNNPASRTPTAHTPTAPWLSIIPGRRGHEAEHLNGVDVNDEFVTGNYGVETTSETEWLFVNGPADTSDEEVSTLQRLNREAWPKESKAKLPDRGKCRKRRPLADVERAAQAPNARLKKDGH